MIRFSLLAEKVGDLDAARGIIWLSRRAPSLREKRWIAVAALIFAMIRVADAQQAAEILIRNGLIVNSSGQVEGDLRIRDGLIAEIGANLTPGPGARVIDATGKLVLPGGIDPHVHLTPVPTATSDKGADDYTSASRSAFAGGKTTIGNFINQEPGVSVEKTLTEAAALVKKQAMSDVILHYIVDDPAKITPSDVAMLYDRQFTLKIFLSRPGFDQNAAGFVNLIHAAGSAGLLTMLHCEDASITRTTRERMVAEGRGALKGQNFPDSAPLSAEEFATQRAVAISEATGAPVYIVHMSSERAMRAAEAGRARGLPVFTEVRFIYLHLTKERFDQPDGPIFTGAPPLRSKGDADYLWSLHCGRERRCCRYRSCRPHARRKDGSAEQYPPVAGSRELSPGPNAAALFGRRSQGTHHAAADGGVVLNESGQAVRSLPAQGCDCSRVRRRRRDLGPQPDADD